MTSSNLELDAKNMIGQFLDLNHFKRQHTRWKLKQKGRLISRTLRRQKDRLL
jgi:hypothetical protein